MGSLRRMVLRRNYCSFYPWLLSKIVYYPFNPGCLTPWKWCPKSLRSKCSVNQVFRKLLLKMCLHVLQYTNPIPRRWANTIRLSHANKLLITIIWLIRSCKPSRITLKVANYTARITHLTNQINRQWNTPSHVTNCRQDRHFTLQNTTQTCHCIL